MYSTVFENAFFLQSVGYAIINSFWQTGLLWFIYQSLTIDKKLSAIVKHHLSVALLFLSFVCFCYTVVQNYQTLTSSEDAFSNSFFLTGFQFFYKLFPYLSSMYFILLCFHLVRFLKRYYNNYFLQTNGLLKAPVEFRLFSTHTARHLGIRRKVQVWMSANIEVPCVTGFIKPLILLPSAVINNLTIQQVESVLIHELAHIKRNDYLINFLQSALELILFFNPFAILLSKYAKKERENCCDDWVLNYTYSPNEYARALLILEEQRHNQVLFAIGATNNKRLLLLRIKRLFTNRPTKGITFLQKAILSATYVVSLLLMFTLIPTMTNSSKEKGTSIRNKNIHIGPMVKPIDKGIPATFHIKPPQTATTLNNPVDVRKKISKARQLPQQSKEYVEAYINEELLTNTIAEEGVATLVSINNDSTLAKYFVKVEEQESGKKQKRTYYFEINNDNGKVAVKPLLIFNKYSKPQKKIPIKKSAFTPQNASKVTS